MSNKLFFLTFFCALFTVYSSIAQLTNHHLTHLGDLTYTPIVNDIWGYTDSAGVEYALVGNYDGVSIVSLANAANPTELFFVNANQSIWRDIKTYGTRAYAVTEGGGGILIIDLSDLPNSIQHHFHTLQIGKAHNLWIDEQGFLFTLGDNNGNGEPRFFDLRNDPDTPVYVGAAIPNYYSHDAYVRGDTLWSASIYEGAFSVFDISNKSNPLLLGSQVTPRNFCHNVWLSDDSKTLFTTDEKAGAWIGSYDVSDLNNIQELDRWRTPNANVVPHNVHVLNDFLVISYYDDGLVVLDGARPSNLVEVARYDTYPFTPSGQFDGAWGAYPFFPSGKIVVSDRQTGLHVFQPTYQRACWLEGLVIDSLSGNPIIGALVTMSNAPSKYSNLLGEYKTGVADAGTYQLTASKLGYITKTISATLQNGQLTIENIELVPSPTGLLSITVLDNQKSTPIANATIEIRGLDTTYIGQTNALGLYQQAVLLGTYTIWAGHWGHQTQLDTIVISNNISKTTRLNQGYKDEFELDLGWTINGDVIKGLWSRETPSSGSFPFFLTTDSDDLGKTCFTTGSYTTNPVTWMDSGKTTISSPVMDLSTAQNPYLNFQYHYYILSHFQPVSIEVILTNGLDTVSVFTADSMNNIMIWKHAPTIYFQDYLPLTNSMQVHFYAYNNGSASSGRIRVWIDDFMVRDTLGNHIAVTYIDNAELITSIAPNPFTGNTSISYSKLTSPTYLEVYNIQGQLIQKQVLKKSEDTVYLGQNWENGIYVVKIGSKTFVLHKQ